MVPSGNMGVFDPTEIHNRGQLKSHMKEAMIKLGFHLLCFFMYLYRLVSKIASKEQRVSVSYLYFLYSACAGIHNSDLLTFSNIFWQPTAYLYAFMLSDQT